METSSSACRKGSPCRFPLYHALVLILEVSVSPHPSPFWISALGESYKKTLPGPGPWRALENLRFPDVSKKLKRGPKRGQALPFTIQLSTW